MSIVCNDCITPFSATRFFFPLSQGKKKTVFARFFPNCTLLA